MAELLVDLGNSRLKLGWLDDDGLQALGVAGLEGIATRLPAPARRVWLSSVAGEDRTRALRAELAHLQVEVREVSVARYQEYLPTRYVAQQLGVDRWLAALAGYERAQGACVVVDAGTATTIDRVDASGVHQGGYILAGEALTSEALLRHTAIRLEGGPADCDGGVPRATREAIRCASLAAQAALIERVHDDMGAVCRIFVGGGNGDALRPYLQMAHEMMPHMVLQGLACLARREE